MKMKMFSDKVNTLSCNIQSEVNEFLSRNDIEVCDIKVSNSDSACVICIFYKLKDIIHARWISKPGNDKVCSNCEKSALLDHEEYLKGRHVCVETDFCPYCGAVMDKEYG